MSDKIDYAVFDIEGTTTSISFVKETLFPYVTANVEAYVAQADKAEVAQLHKDFGKSIVDKVKQLVRDDVKEPALKALQGRMWKAGYASGELKGHVYPDVPGALETLRGAGVSLAVYSSGSVPAQKLLFGYSEAGDLDKLFDNNFDLMNAGSKRVAASYVKIAAALGARDPSRILFVTDVLAEVEAAVEAGWKVALSIRPGNAPVDRDAVPSGVLVIHSFDDLLSHLDLQPVRRSKRVRRSSSSA
jgi:enolase-phosphatase E1